MLKENNPYHICTWDPDADCAHCENQGLLLCRMNYAGLIQFLLLVLNIFIPAIGGMILGGYAVYLISYAVFWIFFFGFLEIRILCSHCPFYAEKGFVLHCPANYGLPKLWKYHPEPMNRLEKAALLVCFAILFGYPLPFLILGRQYILLAITSNAMALWLFVMQRHVCSKCVNFSCPLNRVPKRVADNYLRRNDGLREAWEASGAKM
jgi:hypothetical protein